MVVGTINLVEEVRELAQRGLVSKHEFDGYARSELKLREFRGKAKDVMLDQVRAGVAFAESAARQPKKIVKEGLSEYFIFSVDGTETVKTGWSKRMRLFQGHSVPFRIQYRHRPQEYGVQLVRMFLLRNDVASKLGSTPLPNGVVRLYRDNGRDGLSFLLGQQIKYVPIGQEIELNLGRDPEVIHELVPVRSWRDEFWFQRRGAKVHYAPGKGHRIKIKDTVVGWDDHQAWVERIRNYRDKPIDVQIRRSFDGHAVFRSNLDPTLHDYRSPQLTAQVEAGEKKELPYELVFHRGHNQKQSNVTLESVELP